ncbi:MAG: hypothetical protein K8M05_26540 [Deltaproteobacteria bacterium]|nr:hypothetical protein [Kofleriaceae bacterium]
MKLVLLALVFLAAACSKQAPAAEPAAPATPTPSPAAPTTPTAESIIEAHITATGGRAARQAITSMRATGTMRIAKVGIGGKVEMRMRAPNLAHVVVDIDGLGRTQNGSDGTTVWEKSAMTGARVLEGAERERALRAATLHSELAWRELFTKVELLGEAEFAGRPAWKLAFTTPLGDVETHYYDRETKLELGKEEIAKTQMGEFPTRSTYADYKSYGGLMMASKVIETTQGMDIELTIDAVEMNPSLPADAFAVPADIAPLVAK